MGQITVFAAVANAAVKLPPGRDRDLLERAAALLDFRGAAPDEGSATGARVIEFEDDESTRQIGPICPHCKREPFVASAHLVQFGSQVGVIPALQFACSGCRKVIGISILPPPPMMTEENSQGACRSASGLILPPH